MFVLARGCMSMNNLVAFSWGITVTDWLIPRPPYVRQSASTEVWYTKIPGESIRILGHLCHLWLSWEQECILPDLYWPFIAHLRVAWPPVPLACMLPVYHSLWDKIKSYLVFSAVATRINTIACTNYLRFDHNMSTWISIHLVMECCTICSV